MYKLSEKAINEIENYKPEYQIAHVLGMLPCRLSSIKRGITFFRNKDNKTAQKLRKFLNLSEDDFFEEIPDYD